ncbi:MAG: KH domain-containing protein [Gloeomargarita sp. SKYB31]|nr:KH domain-containing protein [Gloeomargarita sp. SKYB31]
MPDYEGLMRFLLTPMLSHPEELRLDQEVLASGVWLRMALADADRGKVLGRGGRTLQAILTVLQAIAQLAGQSFHLDIYGLNTPPTPERSSPERSERTPARQRRGGQR